MSDLAIRFDADTFLGDLALESGDLEADGLVSDVIASVLCWARARDEDPLPDFTGDRRGWWGDAFAAAGGDRFGSRLWLLARAVLTPATINLARQYVEESLAWMVRDRVVSRVEVAAERAGVYGLCVNVRLVRDRAPAVDVRFEDLWRAVANAG